LNVEKVKLREFNKLLPFGRHIRQRFKLRNLVERIPVTVSMWPEEIVVSDEHGDVGVCARKGAVSIGYTIGVLERAVKTLNGLLKPAVLR